jgi:hypothetical protein
MKIEEILKQEILINIKEENKERLNNIKVGTLLEALKPIYNDKDGRIYNKMKGNKRATIPVALSGMEKRKSRGILKEFLGEDVSNDIVKVIEKKDNMIIAENLTSKLGKVKFIIDEENVLNFKRYRIKKNET